MASKDYSAEKGSKNYSDIVKSIRVKIGIRKYPKAKAEGTKVLHPSLQLCAQATLVISNLNAWCATLMCPG